MKKHVTARKRNKGISLLLFLLFLAGLSLLLYPTFSDWWNSLHQSRAIASYQEAASQLDQAGTAKLWQDAQEYNASLKQDAARFTLNQREKERYESLLCVSGSVMGVVEIPSIHVSLPLYHGTDPEANSCRPFGRLFPSCRRRRHPLCDFRPSGPAFRPAVYRSRSIERRGPFYPLCFEPNPVV